MPKYDVLNQFIHPVTRKRIDPGGSVDLPDTDGRRLVQAKCLRPSSTPPQTASKKKARKKASSRGPEG